MKSRLILQIAFACLALFCGAAARGQSTPDDQARFLSGLPVSEGSPLAVWQREPWYVAHAQEFKKTWRRFDDLYFGKMRAWAASEVWPRIGQPGALYYLFAGPDFINAYALFPNASVYVLGGLEPVGSIVPPEALDADRIGIGLANLRKSTDVTLKFSHFVTKDMKIDLDQTDFRGVLPILYTFVALGGGRIEEAAYFGIDSSGNERPLGGVSAAQGTIPGVRIVFRRSLDAPRQTLYYVQADVSDGAGKSGPLFNWMGRFGRGMSYLKAASYLMHQPYFSRVREFILSHSTAVLQDDSGIPLRYFSDGWRLYFYGVYEGTLEIFNKHVQPELREAFQRGGAAELPFGTGYKWRVGESNLMLAIRQDVPPRVVPIAPGEGAAYPPSGVE
jgi:hypothetical protein